MHKNLRMSFFFCTFAHFLCVVRECTRYVHAETSILLIKNK